MNAFIPQSLQTMSELMDLAAVPYMIVAPRNGKPIIELIQDSMVGSFRMTQDKTRLHEKTFANLMMVNGNFDGVLPAPEDADAHMYTGKQTFSMILPKDLYIDLKNKQDESFVVRGGKIISGAVDKDTFQAQTKGMVSVAFHDYSPFEARRLLDNTQRLICRWLVSAGFSTGISDLAIDKSTADQLSMTIQTMKEKANEKLEQVRLGRMENLSIFHNDDFFEREMLKITNKANHTAEEIALKQIHVDNNLMINMIKSGAKGKVTNVAQMVACVGQQNVDGKRVAYGFTDRTLPHFCKYDDGPEARGFVQNSFISGLTPTEVFFHAMGGREGLIDRHACQ